MNVYLIVGSRKLAFPFSKFLLVDVGQINSLSEMVITSIYEDLWSCMIPPNQSDWIGNLVHVLHSTEKDQFALLSTTANFLIQAYFIFSKCLSS